MMRIFYVDWQQHWKYDRTMNIGANAHGKRAVSTLKTVTSDRLDLRWQLGFQWHRIGRELVLQVPRLFHNATVSQCEHFLLLHIYMYLLFETSPGWRVFFYPRPVLDFGYCRCLRLCVCVCLSVCLCVNHLLVRAITRDLFKLGSPNLDQRCKRPCLRSLLFFGPIDRDLQVKFNLKVRIYPILSLSGP